MKVSKRVFVQGLAATVGAAALADAARAATPDRVWDVIVVGAGTAGVPTAVFAAGRGAKVLLLEKTGKIGGTLAHVSGQIAAAGTRFQAAKGIVDTPKDHFEDAMRISGGTADPRFVRLYTENAAPAVDWLQDHGYRIRPSDPTAHGFNADFRIPRYIEGVDKGRSIIVAFRNALSAPVADGRIELAIHTRMTQLVQDRAGAVTGVVTVDDDGRRAAHRARSVVLTAGGCARNPQMFEQLNGVPLYGREAHYANQGDGIAAAVAAGGYVWNGDKYCSYLGAVMEDTVFPSPRLTIAENDARSRLPWEIFVNMAGRRFMQEDELDLRTRLLSVGEQPGHRYWIVFDSEILAKAPALLPDIAPAQLASHFEFHPSFAKADSLAGLAHITGIDAAGLAQTVAAYNAGAASGTDALGRRHMPLPIAKPPFYGVLHQGWTIVSSAGVAVDESLRVIRKDSRPIPNLYAAGEVIGTGATAGKALGNGPYIAPALAFGRLLGDRILPL